MSFMDYLLRVARSRVTWLVTVPLLMIIIMNLVWFHWHLFFPVIIIGLAVYPVAVIVGLGFPENWLQGPLLYPIGITYMALCYFGFAYFLVNIKKLDKRTLLIVSGILLILILLGMRGCLRIVDSIG
jgi:hypothetical protein